MSAEIYLDNNGMTHMLREVRSTIEKTLLLCSNPSSSDTDAKRGQRIIDAAQNFIKEKYEAGQYQVLFTSGCSESNSFIILECARAFRARTGRRPHIITTSIEHNSLLACCKKLEETKDATITYIHPNQEGSIDVADIESAIRAENTCLISVMYINNETGVINKINEIGAMAKRYSVPLHTDAAQAFGKCLFSLPRNNIAALSASYQKIYGPVCGVCIVSNNLINGYGLSGLIGGTQQSSLRGGTENVPYIAGAHRALQSVTANRLSKNEKLLKMKMYILDLLSEYLPEADLTILRRDDALKRQNLYNLEMQKAIETFEENSETREIIPDALSMLLIGPPRRNTRSVSPNTILLAIIWRDGTFCNTRLKQDLAKRKCIVSIGSACNTQSQFASHVLTAMNMPAIVKRGTIRISLGDYNKMEECRQFVRRLLECIELQTKTKIRKLKKNNTGPS